MNLFLLGELVATPGAVRALEKAGERIETFVSRHASGDWGDLGQVDKKENDLALELGFRIFSAYKLRTGVRIWIITESDCSVTTVLLSDEY